MVLSSPAPYTRVMLLAAGLSCGPLSLICTSYGKGDQTRPSVDGRAVLCSALRCVALRSGRAGAVQQLQIATGAVDGSEAQGLTMRKVAAEAGCFSQISF